jgi:hypothetical protein
MENPFFMEVLMGKSSTVGFSIATTTGRLVAKCGLLIVGHLS